MSYKNDVIQKQVWDANEEYNDAKDILIKANSLFFLASGYNTIEFYTFICIYKQVFYTTMAYLTPK